MILTFQAVNDVGDMDLKRTLEEIKRLQAEANSLKRENIQLKVNTHLRRTTFRLGTFVINPDF